MNLSQIINAQNQALLPLEKQQTFSTIEKYVYFYCDAAFESLRNFETYRLNQAQIAQSIQNGLGPMLATKMLDYERKCILAIETVYTYIHRLELILRPNGKHNYDISNGANMSEANLKRWLQDLRFMSEIRNKIIEHAPENLNFHSTWGQIFNSQNPFEYRLWILHPDALNILNNDNNIKSEINKAHQIIVQYLMPNSDPMFGKLYDIIDGARYLNNEDIKSLFKNALQETGCISHEPTVLAAKLRNLFEFVFSPFR